MPESASTPTQPRSTACATTSSQGSPAATVTMAPPHEALVVGVELDAAGGDLDDGAREALVGDDQVAAAAEHEHRLAGGVGVDQRRRSARPRWSPRTQRSAGPPSRRVVWSASRSGSARRRTAFGMPSTFWPPQVTVSATVVRPSSVDLASPATSISTPPSAGTTTGLVNLQPKLTTSAPGNQVDDRAARPAPSCTCRARSRRAARRWRATASSWWIGLWSPLAAA